MDYVLVVLDAGRRSLVVIDAKASYASSSSTRSRWRPTRCSSTWPWAHRFYGDGAGCVPRRRRLAAGEGLAANLEVAGLQKKVRELLATEVNDLLTADAHARDFDTDTDDWSCADRARRATSRVVREAGRGPRAALRAAGPARGRRRRAAELLGRRRGRNAIERLETAVRTVDPSTRTKSTRRALARGIHLQYEDDEPPSELPPTLRAWRGNGSCPRAGRRRRCRIFTPRRSPASASASTNTSGAARPWPSSWRPRRTTARRRSDR